ncbi:uncharacterized protein VP01_377g9 [Puccinia sorghi]|uniref:Uncharacterized protein n=1 Tax=Puccinia sorghi TaxID=27349 RepID=A0A0L6UTL2_9BASI|nr:uncharacterized protein VP01_377g9 [Puccinia sorghi]
MFFYYSSLNFNTPPKCHQKTIQIVKTGHGRAKGSQGYSAADCTALVAAVKHVLPLRSQEWVQVLTNYNDYVGLNKQAT